MSIDTTTPFSQLNSYENLIQLVSYIIGEIEVKEITAELPEALETSTIEDPSTLLPILNLKLGRVSYMQIKFSKEKVLNRVTMLIRQLMNERESGFEDRQKMLVDARIKLERAMKSINTSNLLWYMDGIQWNISYFVRTSGVPIRETKGFINSRLDLTDQHHNLIATDLQIRFNCLDAIFNLIVSNQDELAVSFKGARYEFHPSDYNKIYSLLFGLIASGEIKYINGDEHTFKKDFLKFFGHTDEAISKRKLQFLDRSSPGEFLRIIAGKLDDYAKPFQRKR